MTTRRNEARRAPRHFRRGSVLDRSPRLFKARDGYLLHHREASGDVMGDSGARLFGIARIDGIQNGHVIVVGLVDAVAVGEVEAPQDANALGDLAVDLLCLRIAGAAH